MEAAVLDARVDRIAALGRAPVEVVPLRSGRIPARARPRSRAARGCRAAAAAAAAPSARARSPPCRTQATRPSGISSRGDVATCGATAERCGRPSRWPPARPAPPPRQRRARRPRRPTPHPPSRFASSAMRRASCASARTEFMSPVLAQPSAASIAITAPARARLSPRMHPPSLGDPRSYGETGASLCDRAHDFGSTHQGQHASRSSGSRSMQGRPEGFSLRSRAPSGRRHPSCSSPGRKHEDVDAKPFGPRGAGHCRNAGTRVGVAVLALVVACSGQSVLPTAAGYGARSRPAAASYDSLLPDPLRWHRRAGGPTASNRSPRSASASPRSPPDSIIRAGCTCCRAATCSSRRATVRSSPPSASAPG